MFCRPKFRGEVEMPVLLGNDDPAHSVTILDQVMVMMMVVMVMMMVVMVIVTILDQVRVDQEDKRTNMYMTCKHTK